MEAVYVILFRHHNNLSPSADDAKVVAASLSEVERWAAESVDAAIVDVGREVMAL